MRHLLLAIGLNAIPLIGVWKFGWSGGTVLLLFWIETLLGHFGAMIKIRRHATLTRKRGHFGYVAVDKAGTQKGSYFAHFSSIAMVFTFAHGIFLGAILAMLAVNRPELVQFQVHWLDLRNGAALVLLLVLVDLAMDLPGIGARSFFWLENQTGKRLSRVLVMHLTIIFGFGAMALSESPMGFLLVFLALKTVFDAMSSGVRDDAPMDAGFPDKPPALLRYLDSKRKDRKESLDEYWAKGRDEAMKRRRRHEEVVPAE